MSFWTCGLSKKKPQKDMGCSSSKSPEDVEKSDTFSFHSQHGPNVALELDRQCAHRTKAGNGLVFLNRPISVGDKVKIKVIEILGSGGAGRPTSVLAVQTSTVITSAGGTSSSTTTSTSTTTNATLAREKMLLARGDENLGLVVGFTKNDPAKFKGNEMTKNALALKARTKNQYWVAEVEASIVKPGSTIEFWPTQNGHVYYSVDGEERGILVSGLKQKKGLWPLIDLQGRFVEICVICPIKPPPDDFSLSTIINNPPEKDGAVSARNGSTIEQRSKVTARSEADEQADIDRERLREIAPDNYIPFNRLAHHIVDMSVVEFTTFRQFIWTLLHGRTLSNELDKVRMIFLWLCTSQQAKFKFEQPGRDSPEELVLGLTRGNKSYAQVFRMLCGYAGIECEVVSGHTKAFAYRPGAQFPTDDYRHSWNLVRVNGLWRPIDCLLAAKRLIGKIITVEVAHRDLDLHYFLTNPLHLIYSHLPDREEHQLLEHPLSTAEFLALPLLKSAFFQRYHLEALSHPRELFITCNELGKNDEVNVEVGFPRYAAKQLAFAAALQFEAEDGKVKLQKYVIHELSESKVVFHARVPGPGNYKLVFYAKEAGVAGAASSPEAGTQLMYEAVAEYRLTATGPKEAYTARAFPSSLSGCYGFGEFLAKYGITAEQEKGIISTSENVLTFRFFFEKPTRLVARLKNEAAEEDAKLMEQLQRLVIVRPVNTRESRVTVFLPEAGEYSVDVFANRAENDGNSLYQIWSYLVRSEPVSTSDLIFQLPQLPTTFLGEQPKFDIGGLRKVTHQDPFVCIETENREVSFRFELIAETPLALRTLTNLVYCGKDGAQKDVSNYVLLQSLPTLKMIEFMLRLPSYGFYKFQIFATKSQDTSEALPNVLNYLIYAAPPAQASQPKAVVPVPFPKQSSGWRESCYLFEPLDGNLRKDQQQAGPIRFRVAVPNAVKVAAVSESGGHAEFHQLEQVNEESSMFEAESIGAAPKSQWAGEVHLAKLAGKVEKLSLCANYDAQKMNFKTLLEYST